MFQDFEVKTRPQDGPPRLAALRVGMAAAGLDGFLVPRADRFQGEYVAPCDERLAWLTGFTGSAGFAAVLSEVAGVFVDGRYRVQVKAQTDPSVFTPVAWPETALEEWLIRQLPKGGVVGFDPWLHSAAEVARLETALAGWQIALRPVGNLVDAIWADRPAAPMAPAVAWPEALAGRSAGEKLALVAGDLAARGEDAALITQPESLCWLLNLRGSDVAHTPLMQAMGLLRRDGGLELFVEAAKLTGVVLPASVQAQPPEALATVLAGAQGRVRVDDATAPAAAKALLLEAGAEVVAGRDPCLMPKAKKHPAEIAATTAAHLRDGAAVARFLHWFDVEAPKGGLTEIDAARALEGFRAETGALKEISFDTISAAGAHAALPHYRVSEESNAPIRPGEVFLIDSGGQYEDGTTDITRTLAVGEVDAEVKGAFTQVLQGMIAVHRARFPKGVAGAHLDALARAALWAAGRDFDHGTGHGVGVYLSVHEGPQRISRVSTLPLEPGMILSNEPGYYREGAFGIRIENLVVVAEAPALPGGDDRAMLRFETLTWAPIDRRMILTAMLAPWERDWLNAYHAEVLARLGPLVPEETLAWLTAACAPI
ncbi:aminopeptidase P family protein [Roseicyclus amphidinii]|uniref:aminopeptidase P family protein n=1 Tax=Roseicyclus amphidinii TaxID=3034232 RepID=UPI003A96B8FC